MTPTIRIDEQVMQELKKRAVDIGMVFRTPNEVLREILGLSKGESFPLRPALGTASEEKDLHPQFPRSNVLEIQQILDAMQPALAALSTNGFYYDSPGKWVAHPDNFVTIRAQEARKKDIAITMYGKPLEFEGLQPSLQIKGDRPSYSRFNVSSLDQVPEALGLIKHAFNLKKKRGRRRR